MKVVFNEPGFFASALAAERWCAKRRLHVGPIETGQPRAINDKPVEHWSRLRPHDQATLLGFMFGDMRRGPVVVHLDEDIPAARTRR